MANKFQETIEPEEVSFENDFNPLDEAVNEKRYTQPNINTTGIDFNSPIEEPRFTPPPFQKSTETTGKKVEKEPINPEMKNMSKKDTNMAASQAAKMILQGYEWLHDLGNKGLQVSEKKLNRLQAEGEINLNALIDYDYGKKMRAGDFFQEYNKQVSGLLKVDEEFKEEVTPVLERVLAESGIGLTDKQMLMYMFGKDIASKAIIFFQQKATLNYMIQSIKEATVNLPTPQPQPQPQRQFTEQQFTEPEQEFKPQPQQEVVIVEPEEFEIDTTIQEYQPEKKTKKRGRPSKK